MEYRVKKNIAFISGIVFSFLILSFGQVLAQSNNQTEEISRIGFNKELPFKVKIELDTNHHGENFLLPNGLQGFVVGVHEGKWLLFSGCTKGMHGFNNDPINWMVYVVDPISKKVYFRSLGDSESGLTQDQIDSLSVTSPQFYQEGATLYVTGGYGFRNSLGGLTTFDILSAIDIPGLMRWVVSPSKGETAVQHIRQIADPIFQITGGEMYKLEKNAPTLLILGQYFDDIGKTTQVYSQQVRRFNILDDGVNLRVEALAPKPVSPDYNLRRRDLNVACILAKNTEGTLSSSLVALSGVFTLHNGIWTVPVSISADGDSFMPNPDDPATFKQGMNNYACPTLGLYSIKSDDMFTVLFGGISFGFFQNDILETDSNFPFINQVTTIKIDNEGCYSQYLMDNQYPVILSTQPNKGNTLLFGANARFIPKERLEEFQFDNGVFNLDKIQEKLHIGYIVGGIQSTLPNTTSSSDTSASPHIFKVYIEP